MKSFAKVAFAGLSGVVLFKLFASIIIPLLGLMLGLVALTVKLAIVAAVVYFIWSLVKKPRTTVGPDGEIVVDAEPAKDVDAEPASDGHASGGDASGGEASDEDEDEDATGG